MVVTLLAVYELGLSMRSMVLLKAGILVDVCVVVVVVVVCRVAEEWSPRWLAVTWTWALAA